MKVWRWVQMCENALKRQGKWVKMTVKMTRNAWKWEKLPREINENVVTRLNDNKMSEHEDRWVKMTKNNEWKVTRSKNDKEN